VTSGAVLRRGFLAVVLPSDVVRWTESAADSVRERGDGLRWTRAEQRHLTLQFLGRVDRVDSLTDAVTDAVRGLAPFPLVLGGAGAFPSARRASVLWLGVAEGADDLAMLAGVVSGATAGHGVAAEARPFRPHVTLARSSRARDLRPTLARLGAAPASPRWRADRVVLFESETRPDGAVHVPRAEFPLVASPEA
jgi:2'-5' RNA ligase